MKINKLTGTVIKVVELSDSAREITILLSEPLDFIAGSFVNIFMDIDGEKVRRAFSISSSSKERDTLDIAVRLSPQGKMTPRFWDKDIIGKKVELMGPLGLNTADKMKQSKIYLFGFGIGTGVVKSIAEHFSDKKDIQGITIMIGNRPGEILFKDYFDGLAANAKNIDVSYVMTGEKTSPEYLTGYIQDHIDDLDFNNSDVYVCGQEVACKALEAKVRSFDPKNCHFFVEAFH